MNSESMMSLWRDAAPWIQGLFGGAAAILLWEAVLKPVRERRSLAHMLAEEVAHNLELGLGNRLYAEKDSLAIPSDFSLSTLVFGAVAARIGELPALTGDIVLLYRRIETLNRMPERWGVLVDQLHSASPTSARGLISPAQRVQNDLDTMVVHYRSGLEKVIDDANALLPRLRASARPWYRIDQLVRKKKTLSIEDVARRVEEVHARNQAARIGGSGAPTG